MGRSLAIVLALVGFGFPDLAGARPKIGLALSGGGARGFAHVGILKVLREKKIPVDYIAGTSMGAFIGAMYAMGYSPEDIEDLVLRTRWVEVFNDTLPRTNYVFHRKEDDGRYLFNFEIGYRDGRFRFPTGVFNGHRLNALLQSQFYKVYDPSDFSKLPIPFCAMATNIENGKPVALDHGNLAKSIYASMAYPGFVSPAEIDGQFLVDGYFSNNLPVRKLREMGADVVIAVDISLPPSKKKNLKDFLSLSAQSVNIIVKRITEQEVKSADVVLIPDLGEIASTNYAAIEEVIQKGEAYAQLAFAGPGRFSLAPADYERYEANRTRRMKASEPFPIDRVEVHSGLNKNFILRKMSLAKGKIFSPSAIRRDLDEIYGWGDFEKVEYALSKRDGKNVLSLDAVEKKWGPNYIRFGMAFDFESTGVNEFMALVNLTSNYVNRFGGTWKSDAYIGDPLGVYTEFFQPITFNSPWFVRANASFMRQDQSLFQAREFIDEYLVDQSFASVRLGAFLGRKVEIAGGYFSNWMKGSAKLSSTPIPSEQDYFSGFSGHVILDRLNQRNFPTSGQYLSFQHRSARWLGNDRDYQKSYALWQHYLPVVKTSIFYWFQGGASYGTTLPFFDQFRLGGFQSFSGYREDEIRGNYLAAARLGYTFPVIPQSTILFRGVRMSVFGDAGNAWPSLDAIRPSSIKFGGGVEIGMDTKLAPIQVGFGMEGMSKTQIYIRFGPTLERKWM